MPKLVNMRRERGYQALAGVKNIPYTIDIREMRLKEMAVAMGAPMKPRRNGPGPHTGSEIGEIEEVKEYLNIPRR